MFLYLAVAACAFLAACLVYRYDLYDREPIAYLSASILVGAICMFIVGRIEVWTIEGLAQAEWVSAASLAAVGATHEETIRFVALLILSWVFGKEFNDPIDGLVYGSMLGLGMALEESFYTLRLLSTLDWLHFPVEFVRLLGHLIMGGITGFGLGLRTISLAGWKRLTVGCVLVSMLLHFSWDWIALIALRAPFMLWWQALVAIQIMLFGMLFYGMLVVVGSDWSRRKFDPHSLGSLWGWPFTIWIKK